MGSVLARLLCETPNEALRERRSRYLEVAAFARARRAQGSTCFLCKTSTNLYNICTSLGIVFLQRVPPRKQTLLYGFDFCHR